MTRPVVLAAVLVSVLVSLPGCVSRSAGTPPSSLPPPSTSTTSAATTTTTTTTTPPLPATAADGGNLAACVDSTCEVRVRRQARIPLAPALGVSAVTIMSVKGDEVEATATMAGSSFLVECTGDERCQTTVVGSTPPTVFLTGHPGALVTLNQTVVEVAAAADGAAILRVRPL